ncbi:MAG: hypothetical protein PVF15_10020 [Candidatus Bathyarchaeota archaeon]|jgi:hypothetical protein
MSMTILKKKTGYALGIVLCVIGVIMLGFVLWKFWGAGVFSSSNILSEMNTQLWAEHSDIALGMGLMLVHYSVFGVVLLLIGGIILVARREKIRVVEEVAVLLECPRCKNQWKESFGKEQLKSMGYPKVRTLSRRKCSDCGKFIRPKIVTTRK